MYGYAEKPMSGSHALMSTHSECVFERLDAFFSCQHSYLCHSVYQFVDWIYCHAVCFMQFPPLVGISIWSLLFPLFPLQQAASSERALASPERKRYWNLRHVSLFSIPLLFLRIPFSSLTHHHHYHHHALFRLLLAGSLPSLKASKAPSPTIRQRLGLPDTHALFTLLLILSFIFHLSSCGLCFSFLPTHSVLSTLQPTHSSWRP